MSAGGQSSSSSPVYPKWAKPYIIKGLEESNRLYDERTPSPDLYVGMDPRRREFLEGAQAGIVDPAVAEYQKTMSGEYLNGSPYLDTVINRSLNDVQGAVGGQFSGSGRYGSGQWAASLADAMTGTAARYRDANYQAERDRMQRAAAGAGDLLGIGQDVGSAFEADTAAQLEEGYRRYREPMEQLNEYLAQVYGNPAVQRPGTKTSSQKDLNWVDILGGLLGCWVAAELFGERSIKTIAARHFCFRHNRSRLVRFYIRHGRAWAAWLRAHPWAKPLVRPIWSWMAKHERDRALRIYRESRARREARAA